MGGMVDGGSKPFLNSDSCESQSGRRLRGLKLDIEMFTGCCQAFLASLYIFWDGWFPEAPTVQHVWPRSSLKKLAQNWPKKFSAARCWAARSRWRPQWLQWMSCCSCSPRAAACCSFGSGGRRLELQGIHRRRRPEAKKAIGCYMMLRIC